MAEPPPLIALPPVPHLPPVIHNAERNRLAQVEDDDGNIAEEEAYLLEDSEHVQRAYQRLPRPDVHLEGRGRIVLAHVLSRVHRSDGQIVFRRTDITVVIKELHRQVIDPPLQLHLQGAGGPLNINPYNEIAVMQQHHDGNDQHILGCYEALWDTNFLYIVTLYAENGDLFNHINWGLGGGFNQPNRVRQVAKQIAENVKYLEDHDLVHRDLKPENIVSTPLGFPFSDFAMTLQIPRLEGNRQLIASQGAAGSRCYWSPEVVGLQSFDHKADVWAYGNILFNLLTGLRLYYVPTEADALYTFFILQGGLGDENLRDGRLEELLQNGGQELDLIQRIQAVQVLDPVATELLTFVLNPNPRNRPDVDAVLTHPFFHDVP
jgi:serine/threonine protein kinase